MRATILALTLGGSAAGCLTYETFVARHQAKYCEELAVCNEDIPCNTPANPDTGFSAEECDFDAGQARQCLNGVWTCSGEAGFEFPIGPQACNAVCGPVLLPTNTER